MKTILSILLTIIAVSANAQERIYLKELDEDMSHPFAHKVAITDANEKILFTETQDDDKQIVGLGFDFYTVYRKSTNKIYVKNSKGEVLSGMEIPAGCYFEAVNFEMLTEHEQFHEMNIKAAFTIVNMDEDKKTVYNKHCKRIGGD